MSNEKTQAVGAPPERHVGRLEPERAAFEEWCARKYRSQAYLHTSATSGDWDAWVAATGYERLRLELALKQTWQMVDLLKPAGEPGSYWRGQEAGIVAALTTLRANLKTPNAASNGPA